MGQLLTLPVKSLVAAGGSQLLLGDRIGIQLLGDLQIPVADDTADQLT